MATESPNTEARIELTVDNDPRLLTGVAAIVSHAAHCSGLALNAQDALAAAVAEAVRETFPLLNGNESGIKLIVEHFRDRVEITIEHSGEAMPTAGLDSFCADAPAGASGLSTALLKTNVDRVKYEARDGRSRTILIKYCAGGAPKEVS
jgi:anti-sigma regulatory factor (Ser/Thr protein kinase)